MNQEITTLLKAAVECSVFISPTDPGLSYQEILEIGKRAGFQQGEVGDSANHAGQRLRGFPRIMPDASTIHMWGFLQREEPDYRNFKAFDFIVSELNARVRADGIAKAQIEQSLLVERAVAEGISRHDIEVDIVYQLLSDVIIETNGFVSFRHKHGVRELPSETLEKLSIGNRAPMRKPARTRVFPIVKDIIERRTDGRPQSIEPLDAFSEQLDKLKYGTFRLWWRQTVAELRRTDPQSSPLSAVVLAAAIVEGALTFVVKHARALNLAVFRSSDFDRDPRTWKIDDLVASAASGSDSAILDHQTKIRADMLIRSRQRIHAGRMLSEFPAGTPDIRPEEARDAKITADQVVRCILDWLQKYPAV
jgi:hypothetical protein